MTGKSFSPAFERNREPILEVLQAVFTDSGEVLEIGSGSGQHAVYFAARLPHLRWQPSELAMHLPSIRLWRDEAGLDNLAAPLALDVEQPQPWPLPVNHYDGIFSANTAHIMAWPQVEQMFQGVAQVLAPGGRFCLYGPFRYSGRHTSDGNARFDASLRSQGPGGIRDIDELSILAERCGLALLRDWPMPANNRTLVWQQAANTVI